MGERGANRLNTVIFLYSNYAISKLREYANHFNNGRKRTYTNRCRNVCIMAMGATVLDIHSGFMNCYEHANTHLEIIAQLSFGFQIDGAAEALRHLLCICAWSFFSCDVLVFSLFFSSSLSLFRSS